MKKLLIVALLALLVMPAMAQYANQPYRDQVALQNHRTGTAWYWQTWAAETIDTSQAIDVRNWGTVAIVIQARDSCNIHMYYTPSPDGVNFMPEILIDSLKGVTDSTNAAGDNFISFALPDRAVQGYSKVKFVAHFETYANGVTTPRWLGYVIRKRY